MGFGPQVVDLDCDGHQDVISGSWPGELYLFRGGEKGFGAALPIKDQRGRLIKVGSATAGFAVDWDNDQDLDLLIGNIRGEVHLVRNEGERPDAFGESLALAAGGEPIEVPEGDAAPVAVDWDRDGLIDLLVGTGAGSVLYYRNVGTAAAPKLAAARELIPAGGAADQDEKRKWGIRAKICVTDWNEDGRDDILLGDCGAQFMVDSSQLKKERRDAERAMEGIGTLVQRRTELLGEYRAVRGPAENEDEEARRERSQRLAVCLDDLEIVRKSIAEEERLVRVYENRRRQMHGYVWLFLRQAPGK